MRENEFREPLNERHYVKPGSTKTLIGVAIEIPVELYDNMVQRIQTLSQPVTGRSLGLTYDDKPRHYRFRGITAFLDNGVAQVGQAVTSDNGGFDMIRLFANSSEEMSELESSCGRYDQIIVQTKKEVNPKG